MSRPATTLNDMELNILLRIKITNETIKNKIKASFMEHRGNLRDVLTDVLDIVQELYMEREELKDYLDPVRKNERSHNGTSNKDNDGKDW